MIAVGNLSLGGTGKTPLASWIARHCLGLGVRPGIVLRGYGADEATLHAERVPQAIVDGGPITAQRTAAVSGVAANVGRARQDLRAAQRLSQLPEGLGAWAGKQFLRIDADWWTSDEELRARLGVLRGRQRRRARAAVLQQRRRARYPGGDHALRPRAGGDVDVGARRRAGEGLNTAGEPANVLPDVLEPGLRVVFCGSAAGAVSAQRGAYYAHPQNRFWITLFETGLTPRRLAPEEFRTLPRYRLGLTDLAKHVSGSDASLPRDADDPEGLRARIETIAPHVLAFNGKRPASVFFRALFGVRALDYGPQQRTVGATAIFVLPSTAPTARAFWTIAPWRALARRVENL